MENKKEIIYSTLDRHLHKHLHASYLHLNPYENWLYLRDRGKSDPETPRKIKSGWWNPQNKENHTWPLAWHMQFISHSYVWASVISVGQRKETRSPNISQNNQVQFSLALEKKNVFIHWIEFRASRKIFKKIYVVQKN